VCVCVCVCVCGRGGYGVRSFLAPASVTCEILTDWVRNYWSIWFHPSVPGCVTSRLPSPDCSRLLLEPWWKLCRMFWKNPWTEIPAYSPAYQLLYIYNLPSEIFFVVCVCVCVCVSFMVMSCTATCDCHSVSVDYNSLRQTRVDDLYDRPTPSAVSLNSYELLPSDWLQPGQTGLTV